MVKRVDPEDSRLLAVLLRKRARATQEQVGQRAGIDQSDLSKIERGELAASQETLEDIAEATWFRRHLVSPSLRFLRAFRLAGGQSGSTQTPSDLEPVLSSVADAAVLAATPALLELDSSRERAPSPEKEARELAEMCSRLDRAESPRLLVEGLHEYQRCEVCLWLCQTSAERVMAEPHRACRLADAASRLADLLAARESRHSSLRCLALARLADARRLCGDLPGADTAFCQTKELWEAGYGPGLFPEWRLYDWEASLRRDQRRYGEALKLHAKALVASGGGEAAGRVLLKKSFTLEQKGDFEAALKTLAEAEPLIANSGDRRLRCVLLFNRAVVLDDLGRHEEVAELLPAVRALTEELNQTIDLIRLDWLEARVLRSRGRRDEALEGFARVRAAFAKEKIAYDTALATLELSELLLERGETGEVKALAKEMLWVFEKQDVQPEARKALRLFCDAAAREAATLDLVRRLVTQVRSAGRR
ncbi:MAG TPA: helix-turn-helix transcriptional regulator [Thermoanaerobaculia bacterium]|nr:helix-turn-helix transcriptional regulator [Thermoanaerobaculia bacterium]